MRAPEDALARVARAWERHWPEWAGGGGRWPLAVPLDAPTAAAARDVWPAFQRWVAAWSAWPGPGAVVWEERRWPGLGTQQVPVRLELGDAGAAAALLGGDRARQLRHAGQRLAESSARWPAAAAVLLRVAQAIAQLDDVDYQRFQAAVDWLQAHPDSGLYQRQLPVPGLDTKWLEAHGGLVALVLGALLERTGPLPFVAGLATDAPLRRMRLLDPQLRAAVGGLDQLAAPVTSLTNLAIAPRNVIVVENLQCLLALGEIPGTVALHGGGYAAPDLAALPWVAAARVIYWGDIDIDGLAILGALRQQLPGTESILMDERTLLSHRELWSVDPAARPRAVPALHGEEAQLLADLSTGRWGVGSRLEQERISWAYVNGAMDRALLIGDGNGSIPGEKLRNS